MLDYKNVEELHKDLVNKKISVTELVKETLNSIKLSIIFKILNFMKVS